MKTFISIIALVALTGCGNPFLESYQSVTAASIEGTTFIAGTDVEVDKKEMIKNGYHLIGKSIVKKSFMGSKGKAVRVGRLVGATHVYYYHEEIEGKNRDGEKTTRHIFQAWFYKK